MDWQKESRSRSNCNARKGTETSWKTPILSRISAKWMQKTFVCILEKVRPYIQKQNTIIMECISSKVSTLGKALKEKILNLPLPKGNVHVPFVIVADDDFPLSPNIMKPFAMKVSQARRTIENVFGILAQRYRTFQTIINVSVEKVELITLTYCVLHNFLRTTMMEENNALTEK
ncbi:hypothetical protein PR048_019952 [Dryococelus australis]|uniref:DDE Tnp4 domain-containing protein n=1 Tax=Dryococelus australis TaxID=614101 RepID=A0ABQ9H4X7_9NEOP|nr:hypothetical protein PR048_019952 [Dryococelus australis]